MGEPAPNEMLGTAFLAKWRAMQPLEQGRPWRWGVADKEPLRRSLNEMRRRLEIELSPAGSTSVRQAYEMLDGAYQSKHTDNPSKRVKLWIETFQDWPHCALQEAVKAWAHKDTPYMPSTGQFFHVGIGAIERRRSDLADVQRILRVMDHPEDENWDEFVVDPEVARKLRRLSKAMRNGEDLEKLHAQGEI
jgi:hypothetical protein